MNSSRFLFFLLSAAFVGLMLQGISSPVSRAEQVSVFPGSSMRIASPAFLEGEYIPSVYTCDGKDVNPPLLIGDVPDSSRSLVLIVDDPDAPSGTWTHWTMWNIPPILRAIEPGNVPSGAVEGLTSFGSVGYGGPCPPSGTHRYIFSLFALDTMLSLPADTDVTALRKAMIGHVRAKAQLIGTYKRP